MISREKSLNKPSDFYQIKKEGILLKSENFNIKYIKSDLGPKFAFVVSKVISPISPKRNKLKRIFKSLIKEFKFEGKYKLVIYPKISALNTKYSELKIEIDSVLSKIKY